MGANELPMSVQQQLARLQQLQQTLSVLLSEKQKIQAELEEIKLAIEELNRSDESVTLYKAVGPLLVQTTREKVLSELTEKRDLDDTRLKVIEKQESRTRAQIEGLQREIQSMIGGEKEKQA